MQAGLLSPIIQFGDFEFDLDRNELRRRGVLIRLQEQPALALAALLKRANEIVLRDELQKAVWSQETFVDFDRGLNFCMTQVRGALGDDAARPVYIKTVPRKGYQFVAPVRRLPAMPISGAPLEQRNPRKRGWQTAAVVAGVIGAAATGIALWSTRRAEPKDPPTLAVVHFDNETSRPELQSLAEGLTDDVVVQLAADSQGHYRVIGNAAILREPRDRRDVRQIGAALHASYVVLGQVRSDDSHVLILAHLIRLSDLTHIWVVRTERDLDDPLQLESQVAGSIATQFANRLANNPDSAASFSAASN